MTNKFQWLAAGLRAAESVGQALVRVRHSRRPRLESTDQRFDPSAHALRGCYLGLLTGISRHND